MGCLTARAASSLADLQEKAAQGDPAAQLELGTKYLFGEGVAKDPGTALTALCVLD
jgi:TPR repeat protein